MFKHFCNHLTRSLAFGLFAVTIFVSPVRADTLLPTTLLPGDSINRLPDFVDPNLQTTLPIVEDFFGSGSVPTGAFAVFVNTSSLNPFGLQDLVFSYEVSVETGNVVQISVNGFSAFKTAVQQTTGGVAGVVPAMDATRSSDGNTLTFNFAGIPGGFTVSSSLNVYTNALNYADPLATIIDASGTTAQFSTTGPSLPISTAVPEPSSLLLAILFALCVIYFYVLRSLKTRQQHSTMS